MGTRDAAGEGGLHGGKAATAPGGASDAVSRVEMARHGPQHRWQEGPAPARKVGPPATWKCRRCWRSAASSPQQAKEFGRRGREVPGRLRDACLAAKVAGVAWPPAKPRHRRNNGHLRRHRGLAERVDRGDRRGHLGKRRQRLEWSWRKAHDKECWRRPAEVCDPREAASRDPRAWLATSAAMPSELSAGWVQPHPRERPLLTAATARRGTEQSASQRRRKWLAWANALRNRRRHLWPRALKWPVRRRACPTTGAM